MDVAAPAPTEIIAPPPRPAAVKADSDERSFDDHLDVAAAKEDDVATAETPPAAGSAAPPAPPSQPVALTLGFQFIASEAKPATAAEAAPAVTPAPPQIPTPAQQQGSAAPILPNLAAPLAASAPAAKAPVEKQTESAKSDDADAAPILPNLAAPPAADIVSAALLLVAAPAPPPLQITPPPAATTAPLAAAQSAPPNSSKSAGAAAPDVKQAPGDAKSPTPRAAAAAKTPLEFAVLATAGEEQAQVARADVSGAALAAPAAQAAQAAQNQSVALETTAVRAAPAMVQVGREIVRRFSGENTRFEMRLDPPELGRIEVRLDVSRDHRVTAVISADNPQALTDLVRHARELEQALQSAGLELSDRGLSFDLRQSKDQSGEADSDRGGTGANTSNEDTLPTAALAARPLGLERWSGLRVDIMA